MQRQSYSIPVLVRSAWSTGFLSRTRIRAPSSRPWIGRSGPSEKPRTSNQVRPCWRGCRSGRGGVLGLRRASGVLWAMRKVPRSIDLVHSFLKSLRAKGYRGPVTGSSTITGTQPWPFVGAFSASYFDHWGDWRALAWDTARCCPLALFTVLVARVRLPTPKPKGS